MSFEHVKPGDTVMRLLGGVCPMELKVTSVTDDLIVCGDELDVRPQDWRGG